MFAGAAFTDEADIKNAEAVDLLTELNIIDGYSDGSFKPEGTVTRAEMAKMIFTIRNGGNATQVYKTNNEITAKLYSEKTSTSLGTATIAITKGGVDAKANFTVKETVVADGKGDISITPTDAAMPGQYKVKATFAGVNSNELTVTITPSALTGIQFDALTLSDLSGTAGKTVADIAIAATGKDYTVKKVEVAKTADADNILASDVALEDSTGYTVKVTVEAKDGYTFPATVNTWTTTQVTNLTGATISAGGVVATDAGNNANSVVVTLTFTSGNYF